MLLEAISLGQGRTHCPGLAADERGVVMGRRLALLFPDLSRVVGFFRSYSREASIDDLVATLEIRESTSELGGREILVSFEAQGSYAADRAAQAARIHRGRVFTGTDKHYVTYRDRHSPLGYDLVSSEALLADPGDLALYSGAGADRRTLGRTLRIKNLLLGLAPRALSADEGQRENAETLVLRVEPGIATEVCRYLWSRQIRASLRTGHGARPSVFSQRTRDLQLIRCEHLPHHVANLLARTPGVDVFVPVLPHVLVQWGFRHPIALESCAEVFPADEFVLFFGPPRPVEQLAVAGEAADIRDLIDVEIRGPAGVIPAPAPIAPQPLHKLHVDLRLARLPGASAASHALLIDEERLPWFVELIYQLPAAILRSYEAALAGPYLILVNRRGVHGVPFGRPMTELYPQVFVPIGMQLLPRVDYDLLREHLQIRPEQFLYFFPEDGAPFAFAQDQLRPLSRAMVAHERAHLSQLERRSRDWVEPAESPMVGHRRQSVFSLWRGTRPPPGEGRAPEALPAAGAGLQLPAPAREDGGATRTDGGDKA